MRMDDIVAQCPSVLAIHDDVFIYRKHDRDHNANIINLFHVVQNEGLVFNSKKCAIKQESVMFFGRVFSAGYSPDSEKIQGISKMTPPQTLKPAEVPPGPWVKIGVDFFQDHLGKKHLIVADYFSKFPYVFPVASAHHFKTITHLRELFAAEGVPAIVMSDNEPPFNGEEFRQFAHDFDFVHTTSSPHFHQSNGFIEAMVKKVKNA